MKIFGIELSLRREQKSNREVTLAEIAEALRAGGSSKSGSAVNFQTALQATAVLACVRVIAEGLAQVPIKLFREDEQGGRAAVRDHEVHRLITRRPNALQTSYEWRETMGLHAALWGNAYNFKLMHGKRLLELLPLLPQHTRPVVKNGDVQHYEYRREDGSAWIIPPELMWHLRGPSWDTVTGLEPVKLAREAIGLALAAEEHAARGFGNGARPGGVLSTEQSLNDEQVARLRENWQSTQGGVANAFKTAVLWGGMKWQAMGANNVDSQLLESRAFQVEEVCRGFRVMPIMIGYSDKTATYASVEQMLLAHVVHTMGPWYERFEQSAERALLTEDEEQDGYYIKFVTAGLMRGAHRDRAEYYARALGAGGGPAWMTQDEIRALEELNPMGGAAANLPLITNAPKGTSDAAPEL